MIDRCNFNSDKAVIFAPHVDDEMIGCSEVILSAKFKEVQIVYIFPEEERLKEGKKMAEYASKDLLDKSVAIDYFNLNSKNVIYTLSDIEKYINDDAKPVLFFPSIHDNHPDHVLVSSWGVTLSHYTNLPVVFYTTRMNVEWCRKSKNPETKRILLNKFYTSQKSLWEYDYKYFLFEGYCVWL